MISIMRLEQEVARRTGPFFQAAQDISVPTSSTTIAAYMPTLKTSALLGGPENLWLLRRGFTDEDPPQQLPAQFRDPRDRIRMVQTFDPGAGRVVVDRNWRYPMQPNELADFCHLHPDQELRVSVRAGLRRCFLEDTFAAVLTSAYGDIDLTYQKPWITNPNQVTRVQYGWAKPYGEAPFEATMQQGHVMLRNTSGPYAPANVWVTVLRPAGTLINGVDADPDGTYYDDDQLSVDLDYAASAGHIEAWHLYPSHMFAAAAGNLQATQEMAAREFTRQSLIWGPAPTRRIGFSEVVSGPLMGSGTR
jgi:hypothetical protein